MNFASRTWKPGIHPIPIENLVESNYTLPMSSYGVLVSYGYLISKNLKLFTILARESSRFVDAVTVLFDYKKCSLNGMRIHCLAKVISYPRRSVHAISSGCFFRIIGIIEAGGQ